jgi:hypothetical protein
LCRLQTYERIEAAFGTMIDYLVLKKEGQDQRANQPKNKKLKTIVEECAFY